MASLFLDKKKAPGIYFLRCLRLERKRGTIRLPSGPLFLQLGQDLRCTCMTFKRLEWQAIARRSLLSSCGKLTVRFGFVFFPERLLCPLLGTLVVFLLGKSFALLVATVLLLSRKLGEPRFNLCALQEQFGVSTCGPGKPGLCIRYLLTLKGKGRVNPQAGEIALAPFSTPL